MSEWVSEWMNEYKLDELLSEFDGSWWEYQ